MRERGIWWLVAATGVACIGARALGWPWLALLLKLGPVALMLWLVATRARAQGFVRWILAGLALGLLGDLFLGMPGVDLFIPGLVAFLLGHFCYMAGFLRDTRRRAWAGALVAFVLVGLVLAWLAQGGRLGDLLVPVIAYSLVSGAMLWRALARLGLPGLGGSASPGAWGAAVFVASDMLLAADRFVLHLPWLGLFALAVYWLGQVGYVVAALRHPDAARA